MAVLLRRAPSYLLISGIRLPCLIAIRPRNSTVQWFVLYCLKISMLPFAMRSAPIPAGWAGRVSGVNLTCCAPRFAGFLASLVLSRACTLLFSLAALFCNRVLCFQSFADSLCKTPGVGYLTGQASASLPTLPTAPRRRNVDSARTSNYHCCKLQVPGPWMKLPN
jgi:hypothetical protein